ncbi:MAG: M48 family metallopeptidase [Clostridia bacterium]|nr:M48 family metallopeptidase [Clostridia bacterium]
MDYKIIYSKRRTLALQISQDCEILIRAPFKTPKNIIDDFVISHSEWIKTHLERRKLLNEKYPPLSDDEIKHLKIKAMKTIPSRVEYFSKIMGVFPVGVSINSAKKRFGSCSSRGRLNFSCRLMLYPDEAVDYVVVHELAHLKHLDHSKSFWSFVERFMPDYRERKNLLK